MFFTARFAQDAKIAKDFFLVCPDPGGKIQDLDRTKP